MDNTTREATLKRDKSGILKQMLTSSFWDGLGTYLKDAAAATYRDCRADNQFASCRAHCNASALPFDRERHEVLAHKELAAD